MLPLMPFVSLQGMMHRGGGFSQISAKSTLFFGGGWIVLPMNRPGLSDTFCPWQQNPHSGQVAARDCGEKPTFYHTKLIVPCAYTVWHVLSLCVHDPLTVKCRLSWENRWENETILGAGSTGHMVKALFTCFVSLFVAFCLLISLCSLYIVVFFAVSL